jgi:bifunctional DNase/RNase
MMEVHSVDMHLPSQYPVVTLREIELPKRDLSFPVGMAEGAALAHVLQRIETPRPLTHELFADVLRRFAIDVVAIRMTGRVGGTYLAELDLMSARGREVVTCRPSDGIVLALRQKFPAPLLVDERLFAGSGDVQP